MRLREFGNDASVFLLEIFLMQDICQTLRIRKTPTGGIVDARMSMIR